MLLKLSVVIKNVQKEIRNELNVFEIVRSDYWGKLDPDNDLKVINPAQGHRPREKENESPKPNFYWKVL